MPCHIFDSYRGGESSQICERLGFLHEILILLLDYYKNGKDVYVMTQT